MSFSLSRILAVMRKDVQSGRRESIITYLILSPLVMAFGFRLLLPILEGPGLTYAVAADVDVAVVAALDEAGKALVLPDRSAVMERVQRIDDVPGVIAGEGGLPTVVLEGNEAAWVQAVPGMVLDAAAGPDLDVQWESLGGEASRLRFILGALMAFTVLLLGGIAIGFLVLEEKESGTLRVFTTSPVSFAEYLTAKVLGVAAVSLPLGVAATWILLGPTPLVPLLVACLGALPAALLLGFLVATFAQDQVAAIALLKSLLFVFTSVPVAGFFLTGSWLWLLAPLSNHHAIQALYLAIQPGAAVPWGRLGLSLLTGLPLVAWVVAMMRARLGFGAAQ